MARRFHRKEPLSALSEINMTPLIDLAFTLLIIFMITTPLLEQTIAINLPVESQKEQESKEVVEYQTISIDKDGDYFWGKEHVDEAQLIQLLHGLTLQSDPPVINLRAERSLPYQAVVTLVDLIKQQNLSKISLDTQVQ